MIIIYTIQHIPTTEIILADAMRTTNRTEFINFLNTLDILHLDGEGDKEGCLFYLRENGEVFYERHISGLPAANGVKDSILDFIASGAAQYDIQMLKP